MILTEEELWDFVNNVAKNHILKVTRNLNETQDILMDLYIIVLKACKNKKIENLEAYAQGISKHLISRWIKRQYILRKSLGVTSELFLMQEPMNLKSPEKLFSDKEERDLSLELIISLDENEILTKFYIEGLTSKEIQIELNLTDTQFRLKKTRLLAKVKKVWRSKFTCIKHKPNSYHKEKRKALGKAATS